MSVFLQRMATMAFAALAGAAIFYVAMLLAAQVVWTDAKVCPDFLACNYSGWDRSQRVANVYADGLFVLGAPLLLIAALLFGVWCKSGPWAGVVLNTIVGLVTVLATNVVFGFAQSPGETVEWEIATDFDEISSVVAVISFAVSGFLTAWLAHLMRAKQPIASNAG